MSHMQLNELTDEILAYNFKYPVRALVTVVYTYKRTAF